MMDEAAQIWQIDGGLRLDGHKEVSHSESISRCAPTKTYTVPLQQHIGKTAEPIVEIGDRVLKGQKIAEQNTVFSASVHSPVSGTVIDIGLYHTPDPSGLKSECIVIENDFKDEWCDKDSIGDFYQVMRSQELRDLIREGGIVGLGGAGFPAAIKQTEINIKTLIINGVECEPYITCDDALMRNRASEILSGADIIGHIIKAHECIIAIEDNKQAAIDAMQSVIDEEGTGFFRVQVIPTIYPSGGEKQIIQIITGNEVPKDGFPADIDVLCQNVGTAYAIHKLIYENEPLISRIVTITGDGVSHPQNMEVPIGTNISECIEQCGGYTDDVDKLIIGGPMMGYTYPTDDAPITKATNCLLLTTENSTVKKTESVMPCIRCGLCTDVCPARLLPQQLYWYSSTRNFERAQQHHLFDCIECGCCSYVCPSKIELVQYFRFAKSEIKQMRFDKNDSDKARIRHEKRTERLEKIKREREKRLQEKRELLKEKSKDGDKQKVIEAALARAKAKKEKKAEELKD